MECPEGLMVIFNIDRKGVSYATAQASPLGDSASINS